MKRKPKKIGNLLWWNRSAEQKALHFIASVVAQERLLLGGLDAFGDDCHTQRLAHVDNSLRDER